MHPDSIRIDRLSSVVVVVVAVNNDTSSQNPISIHSILTYVSTCQSIRPSIRYYHITSYHIISYHVSSLPILHLSTKGDRVSTAAAVPKHNKDKDETRTRVRVRVKARLELGLRIRIRLTIIRNIGVVLV